MGEVATVAAWLDSGNDPDEGTESVADGRTLLYAAAQRGGPEMIRMLIAKGATVDARDDRGWTPLLTAAFENNMWAMEILVESGAANVNARLRELFVHVLSFWRSVRASAEDRAFDRVRARYLPTPYGRWYSYESPPGVVQLPPFLFQ